MSTALPTLQLVNDDGPLDRQLLAIDAAHLDTVVGAIEGRSDHFALFLAWDASGVPKEEVAALATGMFQRGLAYVCTWGPDCERVHDIFDEVEIALLATRPPDSVVMSTWHSSEPLEEALWFFVWSSWPDTAYENSCSRGIAVTIGNDSWAEKVEKYLADLNELKLAVGL